MSKLLREKEIKLCVMLNTSDVPEAQICTKWKATHGDLDSGHMKGFLLGGPLFSLSLHVNFTYLAPQLEQDEDLFVLQLTAK